MRTGAAIATSLAAAMALPGCGAGAREHAGSAKRPPAAGGREHADAPRAARASAPEDELRPRRRGARAAHPRPARRAAPGRPAASLSPLLRAFPILRRPAGSGDRPAGQARALLAGDARERRRLGEHALLIAAARRLPDVRGIPPSWIVPAGERLCLLRGVPTPAAAPTPETLDCVRAAAAARGYLMSLVTGLPGAPGRSSLEGVLPAGARDVRLELADGRRLPVALHEGSYALTERGASALRFERGGHELEVPVPQPPGGQPGL